jgi:hypothetical protein
MGALFRKKCTPLEDLKKRYMVSLGKTWRNKKRLPKFNHTVLGGLSVHSTWDTPHRREKI